MPMVEDKDPSEESLPTSNLRTELEVAQKALTVANARLVWSEKLASLGTLIAGIAHEINTPIGAVRSMHETGVRALSKLKEVLAEELPGYEEHPRISKLLGIIEDSNRVVSDGSQRVVELVRRVRSYARLDHGELHVASVEKGLDDTLSLIHHELKHDVTVHRDYGAVPPMPCFPGRLNQLFLNLLMNARQAMDGHGEIFVRTWLDGEAVLVSIRDTGTGIAKEHLSRIFEPGFTTKGDGVGTGLGLYIVRTIVDEHMGVIEVDSELGVGTTFTLRLPRDLDDRLPSSGTDAADPALRNAPPSSD